MKRVDSGNGRMLANEARAAELKAARARGAREDAARKEDSRTDNLPEDGEEDEVPEPGPTSLEQYIRPGTKPRTNQSNTPHAHVEGTRRSSMSTEAIRNVESDFGFSDSETDRVPASSQASYSHLSAGTDRFSGYKSHVTLRPSFSRTAQGYDVTEPTTALPQPMTFNPQETQYMYPRNNGPFTEYRNEMSRESCTPIHAAETVRGNQPPIRVTLPNNQRRDSHQLEQTTISSTKQDPKHFSNIHADEYEKLRQQLYSLSEVETLKSSRDSVGTATYDPVPRGSNVGLRSSVQTVIHRPLPGELHKSGDIPGATLQNRVIHDTDPKPSWRERHGDLFKESATFPRLGDSILNATTPEGAIGMAGSKMRNNTFAQPTKVAADAPAAAKLSNVDEWWYHEYKKRQNLHDHYANVANAASYHQVPQGPGKSPFYECYLLSMLTRLLQDRPNSLPSSNTSWRRLSPSSLAMSRAGTILECSVSILVKWRNGASTRGQEETSASSTIPGVRRHLEWGEILDIVPHFMRGGTLYLMRVIDTERGCEMHDRRQYEWKIRWMLVRACVRLRVAYGNLLRS